jgi:hypothetical protein
LDLREFYRHTPEIRRVHRKSSFDNWPVAIEVICAWGVLLPKAVEEFRALMALRHHSVHFNISTYDSLKDDALAAIKHMSQIIEQQFSAFASRPLFIIGTKGHVFIKREWEDNLLIRTYFLPTCPFAGPCFSISFDAGLSFHDYFDYGDGEWTDEKFCRGI